MTDALETLPGIGPALAAIGATFALVAALLWLTPRPVYLRGVHE